MALAHFKQRVFIKGLCVSQLESLLRIHLFETLKMLDNLLFTSFSILLNN